MQAGIVVRFDETFDDGILVISGISICNNFDRYFINTHGKFSLISNLYLHIWIYHSSLLRLRRGACLTGHCRFSTAQIGGFCPLHQRWCVQGVKCLLLLFDHSMLFSLLRFIMPSCLNIIVGSWMVGLVCWL